MAPDSNPNTSDPLGDLITRRGVRASVCDCYDYELEEQAVEVEAKEPLQVAAPVQVARPKKK